MVALLRARFGDEDRISRPAAAILSDDPAERSTWMHALSRFFRVQSVESVGHLRTMVEGQEIELVVSGWQPLLPTLIGSSGVRWLHVGRDVPSELIKAIQEGYDIAHAEPHEIERRALELTRGLRAHGIRHHLAGLSLRFANARRAVSVVDISSEGVAFRIDVDISLAGLLPGARLENVEIWSKGLCVVDGVDALVKHVRPLDDVGSYVIGCAFQKRAAVAVGVHSLIRDRAQIQALLSTPVPLVLEPEAGGVGTELKVRHVDAAARSVTLEGEHELAAIDLVRGRFELHGRAYAFLSVVTNAEPLTIRFPDALESSQKRAATRFQPAQSEPMLVALRSPLIRRTIRRPVRDISASGMAFEIDPVEDLFPVGLRVDMELELDGQLLRLSGRVRSLARRASKMQCGVEFEDMDEKLHATLAGAVMRLRVPSMEDGSSSAGELFSLFRESGYLRSDVEAALAPVLPEVSAMLDTLANTRSNLFKSVVVRDGKRLVGHISGLRIYRRTWMSQHLAALPGKHAGHLLNLAQGEYFAQNPDLEYHRIWFEHDNRWPSRVFGGFARKVTDPSVSILRNYAFIPVPVDRLAPVSEAGIEIIEATGDDLALVERWYVEHERPLLLHSEDLLRDGVRLDELNAMYRKLGLYRRRHVLLAVRQGVLLGFALAEVSSPGLNLFEVLSTWRMQLTDAAGIYGAAVRRSLLAALSPLYRQAGRTIAPGFVDAADAASFAELGVPVGAHLFGALTCHRALFPRFSAHVTRMFSVLEKRARSRA